VDILLEDGLARVSANEEECGMTIILSGGGEPEAVAPIDQYFASIIDCRTVQRRFHTKV